MAGVIDDLQYSLIEILRARDIPISVVIIKVGSQDEQDSNTLMTKAGDVFKQCERTFVDLIELDKFKVPSVDKPLLTDHFAFEVVRNIPS